MNIYKFPFSDPRFINVKLEELEENYSSTIVRIARHLGIPEDVMLKTSMPFDLKTMTDYPEYVTREKLDVHSNSALFKPHHYRLFSELFPADLLSRLGYDS